MSDNWLDQIADFVDGSPTREEGRRLNEWIKAEPRNVRRFLREAIVHSRLHDLLNGEGPYAGKWMSQWRADIV